MKISGAKAGGVNRTDKSKGRQTSKTKSSGVTMSPISSGTTADSIEVSDHAATMEVIKGLVADTPDIRTDEVDRIVNQLKGGKYKMNFERVAEGFIKEAILNEISKKPRSGKR